MMSCLYTYLASHRPGLCISSAPTLRNLTVAASRPASWCSREMKESGLETHEELLKKKGVWSEAKEDSDRANASREFLNCLPSDTKLLLTKKYSEIIIFGKLRISRVIPWKCLPFLDISRGQNASKITKNNSQGIIFVIILCQRAQGFLLCRTRVLNQSTPEIAPEGKVLYRTSSL